MSDLVTAAGLSIEDWLACHAFVPAGATHGGGQYHGALTPQAANILVERYLAPILGVSPDYQPRTPICLVLRADGAVVSGERDLLAVAQGEAPVRCVVVVEAEG